jgi:phospholipase/carboxylesterase
MDWNRFEQGWRCAPLAGPARSLVVLLHDAASAFDLLPLAQSWCRALPDTAFASFDGERRWRASREIDELRRPQCVANAYASLYRMLCNELAHYKLDFDRLAIVGFSKGSILALHHVATNRAGAAAVLAYSGRLASPIVEKSRTPVTLVHGTDDEVIPVVELERAAHALSDAGYAVEAYALPAVGHTISSDGVLLGRDALVRALVERPLVLARARIKAMASAQRAF